MYRCTVFSLKLICKMYIRRFFIALLLNACYSLVENMEIKHSLPFLPPNNQFALFLLPILCRNRIGMIGTPFLRMTRARLDKWHQQINKRVLEASSYQPITVRLTQSSVRIDQDETRIGESNSLRIPRFVRSSPNWLHVFHPHLRFYNKVVPVITSVTTDTGLFFSTILAG